jgi:hypothetical protein
MEQAYLDGIAHWDRVLKISGKGAFQGNAERFRRFLCKRPVNPS